MENYRLTQTGEEVQDILNGAAMQTDLTAENERAEGAEQTLQGNIDEEERRAKAAEETLSGAIGDEELRAKAAEEALGDAIDGINAKIPAAASSENKLADQDFVNSSIETATATFRGTFNLVSDLHLAVDATHAQIATLLGTVIAEADNNDYSYVLIPTSAQTPTEIASIEKYTFRANGWAFAYALNNSGFTSAQWAALNSGITSGLVSKLNALPTNDELTLALAGKQDVLTFDDVPVEGSNNPVKSGGVHSAIDDEKTARVNAVNGVAGRVDTIEGEIPAQASSENQLADKAYVNSSISTNTATYRGSFNLVADLGLSVSATHEQIGTALAGEISTADNNDYAYVQVPTSDETPSQILKVERYKFNGTAWAFEYELNNSGFTSAQWAALNSGITSGLVGKLNALPTNDELTLALAGKQDVLTFDNTPTENSNNPVKSGGVYAADKALSDAIEAILLLIPSAATSLNKLVDTDLMNSSISTATATFRGTFNLVTDLSLDLTATHAQIATALAGAIATADNNDYAFVQVPTAVGTPTEIAQTDRYKFNGTAWAFEYELNTSGFTSAQWAAINSGITAALVASLADIPDLIPSEATSANQLADKAYVLAQILAATPAFKGQFTTLAELQAIASPKAGDLGIVRTKDSDGMDVFTIYQYLNNAWNVFYSLSYHPQTKPATTGTTGDYPYNGMGRVELAKNMVNTGTELAPVMVNQLTQDMFYKGAVGSRVPNTNTIFVIRYDYVLGEDITVPANCVLEFEGGSISGTHTLTGTDTKIIGGNYQIFATGIYKYKGYSTTEVEGLNQGYAYALKVYGDDVELAGTWNNEFVNPAWVGLDNISPNEDSRIKIQRYFTLHKSGINISIPQNTYYCYGSLNIYSSVDFNNSTIICCKYSDIYDNSISIPADAYPLPADDIYGLEMVYGLLQLRNPNKNAYLKNLIIDGNTADNSEALKAGMSGLLCVYMLMNDFIFDNVILQNTPSVAIIGSEGSAIFNNCKIQHTTEHGIYGHHKGTEKVVFNNCVFFDCGESQAMATARGGSYIIKNTNPNSEATTGLQFIFTECQFINDTNISHRTWIYIEGGTINCYSCKFDHNLLYLYANNEEKLTTINLNNCENGINVGFLLLKNVIINLKKCTGLHQLSVAHKDIENCDIIIPSTNESTTPEILYYGDFSEYKDTPVNIKWSNIVFNGARPQNWGAVYKWNIENTTIFANATSSNSAVFVSTYSAGENDYIDLDIKDCLIIVKGYAVLTLFSYKIRSSIKNTTLIGDGNYIINTIHPIIINNIRVFGGVLYNSARTPTITDNTNRDYRYTTDENYQESYNYLGVLTNVCSLSANIPSIKAIEGAQVYDKTSKKLLIYDGTNWRDALGNTVI